MPDVSIVNGDQTPTGGDDLQDNYDEQITFPCMKETKQLLRVMGQLQRGNLSQIMRRAADEFIQNHPGEVAKARAKIQQRLGS